MFIFHTLPSEWLCHGLIKVSTCVPQLDGALVGQRLGLWGERGAHLLVTQHAGFSFLINFFNDPSNCTISNALSTYSQAEFLQRKEKLVPSSSANQSSLCGAYWKLNRRKMEELLKPQNLYLPTCSSVSCRDIHCAADLAHHAEPVQGCMGPWAKFDLGPLLLLRTLTQLKATNILWNLGVGIV